MPRQLRRQRLHPLFENEQLLTKSAHLGLQGTEILVGLRLFLSCDLLAEFVAQYLADLGQT